MNISLKQAMLFKQGCLALAERCKYILENPTTKLFGDRINGMADKTILHETMEDSFREAANLGKAIELQKIGEDE